MSCVSNFMGPSCKLEPAWTGVKTETDLDTYKTSISGTAGGRFKIGLFLI